MDDFFTNFENTFMIYDKKNIKEIYQNMIEKINNLENENINLKDKVDKLENELNLRNKDIDDKNDELATYKKSSLLVSMNKQVSEQKNYISILEQQLKNLKAISNDKKDIIQEPLVEVINNIDNKEEEKKEYETIEFKNKKYYLIKKKVYRINKDNTLGELYGKYKNGEIVKNT